MVFVIYVLLGFFALPPLIKWQMLKQLRITSKRNVSIELVKFNPLVLSLTVRGLTLTEPDGSKFVSWDELNIIFKLPRCSAGRGPLRRFAWSSRSAKSSYFRTAGSTSQHVRFTGKDCSCSKAKGDERPSSQHF
jgi:hypothetical protein